MANKIDQATVEMCHRMLANGDKPGDITRACAFSYNTFQKLRREYKLSLQKQESGDSLSNPSPNVSEPSPAPTSKSPSERMKSGGSSASAAFKLAKRNKLQADNLERVKKLKRRIDALLDKPDCGASPGQSVASAAKALIDAVDSLHELELKAHGLEAGTAAVENRIVEVPAPVDVEAWQSGQALAISGAPNPNTSTRRN